MVEVMGYPVYDCDSRAKWLMEHDGDLRDALTQLLGAEVYRDGCLDRDYVSRRIFGDAALLAAINAAVHPAVARDLQRWRDSQDGALCFAETAIVRTSRLDKVANRVWWVDAPIDVRIKRVMARNGVDESRVRQRMQAQSVETPSPDFCRIVNDGNTAVLPQVMALLGQKGR